MLRIRKSTLLVYICCSQSQYRTYVQCTYISTPYTATSNAFLAGKIHVNTLIRITEGLVSLRIEKVSDYQGWISLSIDEHLMYMLETSSIINDGRYTGFSSPIEAKSDGCRQSTTAKCKQNGTHYTLMRGWRFASRWSPRRLLAALGLLLQEIRPKFCKRFLS